LPNFRNGPLKVSGVGLRRLGGAAFKFRRSISGSGIGSPNIIKFQKPDHRLKRLMQNVPFRLKILPLRL
jgi:hypothetical protein